MAYEHVVVAVLRLQDDVAPPAGHGEQDARDPDGEDAGPYPRPGNREVVHVKDEAERRAETRIPCR